MRVDLVDMLSNHCERKPQVADMHLHALPPVGKNDSSDMRKLDSFGDSWALLLESIKFNSPLLIIITDPHIAKTIIDRLSHLASSDPQAD